MDNHPIPQDITGFQFKLIGDMTIKQFIYLAIGAVFAFFFFFILDIPTLVQWPLSLFCLGTGIIIAFVPVDGRPMDTMIRNFFRALISPTQFIYQKGSVPEHTKPIVSQERPTIAHSISINQSQTAPPPVNTTNAPANFPEDRKTETKKEEPDHKKENEELKKQLEELQKKLGNKEESKTPPPPPQQLPQQGNQDLENMLTETQRQKEALEKQILEMQAKQEASKKEKFTPVTAAPMQQTQNVRRVQADAPTNSASQGLPEAPNLISGFIKDSRGNPLQNILIEVLDEDSNPVRAFKTNALGKFAAATSLSNGKYTISFEDPNEKHKFDAVEMELVGSPIMPIEVISIDSREELRRELFN